jgi:hypothetical protein
LGQSIEIVKPEKSRAAHSALPGLYKE